MIFPDAIFDSHIAILGKTGSGKTWLSKACVETLLSRGKRVCVVDPTGVWFGLRMCPDGTPSEFKPVIFGGKHGDLPLHEKDGEAIARIIGESSTSTIIDTSLMRVGERTRFFADLAETLLRTNRGHLHLVIDEAHLFAPQGRVNDPQSGQMLHAANNLISLGRSRGLHVTMITQRPAKLHKDSLTQVETLIAMRLVAPQDRKAIEAWIADWADPKKGKQVISSLPSLKTGYGWLWAPEQNILRRFTPVTIATYDSGKGPEEDDVVLRPIDVDEIRLKLKVPKSTKMEAAVSEPEKKLPRMLPANDPATEALIEQRGYERGYQKGHKVGWSEAWKQLSSQIGAVLRGAGAAVDQAPSVAVMTVEEARDLDRLREPAPPKPKREISQSTVTIAGQEVHPAAAKMLRALSRSTRPLTWDEVAVCAGMTSGNGYFYGGRKDMLRYNLVEELDGLVQLSAAAINAGIIDGGPAITPEEIVRVWTGKLRAPAPQMLEFLFGARGAQPITPEELAARLGMKPGNGYWYGGLSALRDAKLIEQTGGRQATVQVAPILRSDHG